MKQFIYFNEIVFILLDSRKIVLDHVLCLYVHLYHFILLSYATL